MTEILAGNSDPHATPARPLPTSRALATAAMVLWVCSLMMLAVAPNNREDAMPGWGVLTIGWMAVLSFNFAWLANPTFLFAIHRLKIGKPALTWAVATLLLSLDTFRASQLGTGNGTMTIRGYGWGAVLWVASFCLLVSAAAVRERESRPDASRWLEWLGYLLCAATVGVATQWALTDRSGATTSELRRLNGMAFSREAVCKAREASVTRQIAHPDRPLELLVSGSVGGLDRLNVSTLLSWGVQTVRWADRDYSYIDASGTRVLTSMPANGQTGATLSIDNSMEADRLEVSARLVESGTNQVVFQQSWRQQHRGSHVFCPEYSTLAKVDVQPRKLLGDALGSDVLYPRAYENQPQRSDLARKRIDGFVVPGGGPNAIVAAGIAKRSSAVQEARTVGLSARESGYARACPDGNGWDPSGRVEAVGALDAFHVGAVAFHVHDKYSALCSGADVFMTGIHIEGGKLYLNFHKRLLADFRVLSSCIVVVEDPILFPSSNSGVFSVVAVEEDEEGSSITLFMDSEDRTVTIRTKGPCRN